jgi:hypothetical protein
MVKIKYTDLRFGELYETTKEHVFSFLDENYTHVTVPENSMVLFRSFKKIKTKDYKEEELALFYLLKERATICVVVAERTPILYMRHIEWEERHKFNILEEKVDN